MCYKCASKVIANNGQTLLVEDIDAAGKIHQLHKYMYNGK